MSTHPDDAGSEEGNRDGYQVDGQLKLEEFGDRVVNVATPHDRFNDRSEVVVRKDYVGRFFGYVRTRNTLVIVTNMQCTAINNALLLWIIKKKLIILGGNSQKKT